MIVLNFTVGLVRFIPECDLHSSKNRNNENNFKIIIIPRNNGRRHRSDDDDDSLNTIVPFQVAYAVSIHKAQGLEYDSVKIVITDSNEDDISHSIFYTAITRTRNQLKVFWTPETQQKVLSKLSRNFNGRDLSIIRGRRNLSPI